MPHELRGRPAVPPSLWRLQRVPERHHAEREEPAELRAVSPQVNGSAGATATAGGAAAPLNPTFLCPLRDEGLNSSQAHIALSDHASLFHQTKEQLDGRVYPSGSTEMPGPPVQ